MQSVSNLKKVLFVDNPPELEISMEKGNKEIIHFYDCNGELLENDNIKDVKLIRVTFFKKDNLILFNSKIIEFNNKTKVNKIAYTIY